MNKFSAIIRSLVVTLALVSFISAAGCKTAKKAGEDETAGADENMMGDSDTGKAMGLQTIHFPYDAFTLNTEAKAALKNNAQIMKDKPGLKIQVEGHADERGGIQYNIALGEKRANAVKKYLQDLGVAGESIATISYGKERPVDQGHTEEAWAKNRRANFAITTR